MNIKIVSDPTAIGRHISIETLERLVMPFLSMRRRTSKKLVRIAIIDGDYPPRYGNLTGKKTGESLAGFNVGKDFLCGNYYDRS